MPIRTTFTGDVTDLRRGTQQAREEFRKVGTEAEGAARKLKAAGSSFDGTKIEGAALRAIKGMERIGDVTRLTSQELTQLERKVQGAVDKFRVMGTEVSPAIQKVARDIAHIRAVEEDLARTAEKTTAALKAQAQQAHQAFQQQAQQQARVGQIGQAFAGGLGVGIGAGAGIGAAAVIGSTLRDQVTDIVRLGDEYARISKGFTVLQGGADKAEESLDRLRGATRGMVTDTNLMLAANQASVLKLNQLGVATEDVAFVATRLGAALGRDATTSINDMTTALARGSFEILDNLGISLKLSEAYAAFAPRIGKTADQLTDLEKKQAFATIAMERGREVVAKLGADSLTAGQQVERLETAWDNLKASLGASATAGGAAADFLGGIADEAHGVVDEVNEAKRVLAELRNLLPAGGGGFSAGDAGRAFASGLFATQTATNRALIASLRQQLDNAQSLGLTEMALPGMKGAAPTPLSSFASRTPRTTFTDKELEQAQRVVDRQLEEAKRQNDAINRLAEERRTLIAKLTGQDIVGEGVKTARVLREIGTTDIPTANLEAVSRELIRARSLADQTSGAYREMGEVLNSIQIKSGRVEGLNPLFIQGVIDSASRNAIATAARTTGSLAGFTGQISSTNPLSVAGLAPTIEPAIVRVSTATRKWQAEVRGVAQAFAQLAQIAGPSLNGVTRGLGTMIASVDAAGQLVDSLSKRFPSLSENVLDANGNVIGTRLSGRGRAIAGSLAAFTTGAQLGSTTSNPWLGAALGAGGGALVGAMSGPMLGLTAGATIGVTAGIGAAAAIYMAWRNRQAEKKALSEQRAQVIASAGGYEKFREAVEGAGFEFDHFLTKFNSNDADVFTEGMNQLNVALAEQTTRASALTKGLNEVARVQGVLSAQQIAQIRNLQPGDPGAEEVVAFAAQQRQQAESGLTSAIAAINSQAQLTDQEIEELTRGITDAAERQRVIEAALKRKATETLERFGMGAQAAASGLFVAFTEAVRSGENAIDVLRRLGPSITALRDLYQRAGVTPGAGFQQLQFQAGMVQDTQTGAALQLAQGLGQALAGYANTGLLSPELFGELANGIGQAYKQLELLGKGGLEAARLMQPSLQAIWQMIQDNPALRGQLDDTTLALLDFAEKSGLIGDEFRPAIDLMIRALNELIAKLNEFITRIGQIPGMPAAPTPGDPGDPSAPPGSPGAPPPPGEPDPGTPGTPSNPNPPPNGGDYTQQGLRLASMGGASPDRIVPLSGGGAAAAPLQITVVSNIDGYEAARAVTRHQPAVYRQYGAA